MRVTEDDGVQFGISDGRWYFIINVRAANSK